MNKQILAEKVDLEINYDKISQAHAAKQYIDTKISTMTVTVTTILGPVEASSFCQSAIGESRSILPIMYLGITFYFAFGEWLACSKANEAFLPALLSRTIGPPGCQFEYLVRSQTLSLITSQRSVSVLCLPTYSQVYIGDFIC